MKTTLAFDIYGTLIDTNGVVEQLQHLIGDAAPAFSQEWRAKQLEYSFRRGLMEKYQDFAACTRESLLYCRDRHGHQWSDDQTEELLQAYRALPAFADVAPALQKLRDHRIQCHAFSNGGAAAVKELLAHAGLQQLLPSVVSVDAVKTFKPSPKVYHHFTTHTGAAPADTWLISGNPFDILGAAGAGWKTAWLNRAGATFDPWHDFQTTAPTIAIKTLAELPDHVIRP